MRAKEFEMRAMLLLVILAETAAIGFLLYEPKPAARTQFAAEAGSNISLLVNGDRFPIETKPGQKVTLTVENARKAPPPMSAQSTAIPYSKDEEKMSRVTEPRFRFVYNEPKELHRYLVDEKLDKLRGADEWNTVENVLKWGRSQFEPGTPKVYPTQNASRLLPVLRSGKEQGFCSQYCYVVVQALQSLGYRARYVTIVGNEVAEVWLPRARKWVALDPMHAAFFEDSKGKKLSALEIYRSRETAKVVSDLPNLDVKALAASYRSLAYWLRNDLYTTPINVHDLKLYQVRLILVPAEAAQMAAGDLYTFFPEEIYAHPEEIKNEKGEQN